MNFVYPEFLWAMGALSIPVIIHLFNFRRFKKIFFTNVKFLREIKEQTQSRSKLRHLLVLACRLLAVTFLVLAFAQPYIPVATGTKITNDKAISIYVDNTFSMEAITREGTVLDEAKRKAREAALAYKPSDRFQLLTSAFKGTEQRMLSREEFLTQLDQVTTSTSVKVLSEIMLRQKEALANSGAGEKTSYIISDFQKSVSGFETLKPDSAMQLYFIPVSSSTKNNISIDSCWLSSPVVQTNKPCELNVLVRNYGTEKAENVSMKLSINGLQKSAASFEVDGSSVRTEKINFSVSGSGWQQAEVSITDHPVTFDDRWFFSFHVSENIKILSINRNDESPYLHALFRNDPYFIMNNSGVNQVDYSSFPSLHLIVLNELPSVSTGLAGELKKFLDKGGSIVVFPDSSADLVSYNSFFSSVSADIITEKSNSASRVERISTESDLFKEVFEKKVNQETMDMPSAYSHFIFTQNIRTSREVLMRLQDGSSFLNKYEPGKGKLFIFSVSLQPGQSSFPRHAFFVPVMYNIALQSVRSFPLSYTIGNTTPVELENTVVTGEDVFHLVNTEKNFDLIPGHRATGSGVLINLPSEFPESGNYRLTTGKQTAAVISMNYNRKESDLSQYDAAGLKEMIERYRLSNARVIEGAEKNLTAQLASLNQGIRLWKYCVMLVLLFLLCEILLLRFFK